jgi:hypothetical protein
MRFAQEDEAGVRGQVKGFFPKAMEVEVHQKISLVTLMSLNKKGKKKNSRVHLLLNSY